MPALRHLGHFSWLTLRAHEEQQDPYAMDLKQASMQLRQRQIRIRRAVSRLNLLLAKLDGLWFLNGKFHGPNEDIPLNVMRL
jgi:hypothetical protein